MSSTLPPLPYLIPVIDPSGFMSRPWQDFFQKARLRMGGNVAETNEELYTVETARLDDQAVTAAKIATAVAGSGLAGGGGSALSVNVDSSTIEINSDTLRVVDSGISTAKVADGAISFVKMLSTDWTKSTSASGYTKLPNGIYIQWGVTGSFTTGTTNSVSFPTTFPNACRQVIAGPSGNSGSATTATGHWGTGNYSTTAFDLYNRTSITLTFNYIAVGY